MTLMTHIRWILPTLIGSALLFFAFPALAQTLQNPLTGFDTLSEFIEGAMRAVVMIALPIITVFIVIAGFMYVWARGNSDKIKTAHTNFLYVLLGTTLILGAWVLATLIGGTVTQLMGN